MTYAPDTCTRTGKVRYATRSGAFVVVQRMARRLPGNGIKAAPCKVYRCPMCHWFHVGHTDFRKARK